MDEGKAGDAFVQITPSAEGLQEKVTEEVGKVDAKIEAPIEPQLDETKLEEEKAKLDELARDREAHIVVNTTEIDAEIDKLLERIQYLEDRIDIKRQLGLSTDYAENKLAEVEAQLEALQTQRQVMLGAGTATATVEQLGAQLDEAAQARVQLGLGDAPEVAAAVHAELERAATAEVHLDTAQASAELAALAAEKDLALGGTSAASVAPASALFPPIFATEPAAWARETPTGPRPATAPGAFTPAWARETPTAPRPATATGVGALIPAAEDATRALDLTGASVEELGARLEATQSRIAALHQQIAQLYKLNPSINPWSIRRDLEAATAEAETLRGALTAARDAETEVGTAAEAAAILERDALAVAGRGPAAAAVANKLGTAFTNPDVYAAQATKALDNALARVQGLGTGAGLTDVIDENIAPAEAKLGILRAQLEALKHYLITPEMDIATFEAQLGLIKAEMAALSHGQAFNLGNAEQLGIGPLLAETTGRTFSGDVVDTRVRLDAAAATADLTKFEAQLAALPPEKTVVLNTVSDGGGAATGAAAGAGGGLMAGALALSPALIPLGAVGLADLGAMTSLFPLAIAGVETLKLGFYGVQNAITAADKYAIVPSTANLHALQIAMAKLSPAGKDFVDFYEKTLHPALKGFIAIAQTNILGGLTDGLKASKPAWGEFSTLIGMVSKGIGDLFRGAGTYIAGPEFKTFMDWMIQRAPAAIRTFGELVGNVFRGFVGLSQAFGPWADRLGGWLLGLTTRFKDFGLSAGAGKNDGFTKFMAYVVQVAPTVQDFFHQVWTLIGHITDALSGVGFSTLGELTLVLKAINAIPQPLLDTMITMWVVWKQVTWVNNLITGAGALGTMLTKLQGIKAIGGLVGVLGGALIGGVVVIAAMALIGANQGRFGSDPTGIDPKTAPAQPGNISDYMQQGNAGLSSFFGAIGQLFQGNYSGPGGLADWSSKQRDLLDKQIGQFGTSPLGSALGRAGANQAQPAPAVVTGRFGSTPTTSPDNRGSRGAGGTIPTPAQTANRGGPTGHSAGGTFPAQGSAQSWWDRLTGGNLFTGPGSISDQFTKNTTKIGQQWSGFWGGLGHTTSTAGTSLARGWQSFWGGLGSWWNTHVVQPLGKGWNDFWSGLGRTFSSQAAGLSRGWNSFWGGLGSWWNTHVVQPLGKGWSDFWTGLGKTLTSQAATLGRGWNSFWGGLGSWWNTNVVQPIGKGWNDFWGGLGRTLATQGASLARGWQSFWAGMQADATIPVNWVIDNVINGGVIKAVNAVGGLFGMGHIGNVARVGGGSAGVGGFTGAAGGGGPVRMMATGGVVPGVGDGDTVPALLTPGEFVVPRAMVPVLGGHGALEAVRSAVTGRPSGSGGRYAAGGAVTGVGSALASAGNLIAQVFTDPAGAIRSLFGSTTVPGNSGWVAQLSKIPVTLMNDMIKLVTDKIKTMLTSAGGAFAGAAPAAAGGNVGLVQAMAAARGWTGALWNALYAVIMRESGFNNNIKNPTSTAYGMFQFLDSTWAAYGATKTSNPVAQTVAGLNYIAQRYANPAGALAHEQQFGWYDEGGMLPPGVHTVVNRTGVPERILSAAQSASFDRLVGHLTGRPGTPTRPGNTYAFYETGWDVDRIMGEAERRERLHDRAHP